MSRKMSPQLAHYYRNQEKFKVERRKAYADRSPERKAEDAAKAKKSRAALSPERKAEIAKTTKAYQKCMSPERIALRARKEKEAHLKRTYGLLNGQFTAMSEAQGGRCKLCNMQTVLVIDHCHETGVVRGLLCSPCNRDVIGGIENRNIDIQKIVEYLA